jgi:hypothetical protein
MWLIWNIGCSNTDITVTWYGVTTMLIEQEDTKILVDPFFSRPEYGVEESTQEGQELFLWLMEQEEHTHIDAILVSHSHFDHVIDVGFVAQKMNAQIYGSTTTCFIAQAQGIPAEDCTVIQQGMEWDINEWKLESIRTPHWWSTPPFGVGSFEEYTDEPFREDISTAPNGGMFSFLISSPDQHQVFIQNSMDSIDSNDGSDENFLENMKQLFAKRQADLWITCGNCLSKGEEVLAYHDLIQSKDTLLGHYRK